MTIILPHSIKSLTLENLPKLTEFRVLSEGGDRDMPSEAAGSVYLQQLPNLREFKCGIKGTIEMDETVDPKQIDLTLNDLTTASVRLVGNPDGLTIRSDEIAR